MEKVDIIERQKVVVVVRDGSLQQSTTVLPHSPTTDHHPVDEFEDGKIYAFCNDELWLNNYGGLLTDGNKIQVWKGDSSAPNYWRVYVDNVNNPPWGYRLETGSSKDSRCVATATNNFQNHQLVLKGFNGERDQFWHLIKIPGSEKYQIINSKYGKAICSNGIGINCRAIEPDVNDLHQHWFAGTYANPF